MDTIRGDVEIGGDVVVKNGFVALKLPKAVHKERTIGYAGKSEDGTEESKRQP